MPMCRVRAHCTNSRQLEFDERRHAAGGKHQATFLRLARRYYYITSIIMYTSATRVRQTTRLLSGAGGAWRVLRCGAGERCSKQRWQRGSLAHNDVVDCNRHSRHVYCGATLELMAAQLV